MIQFMWCQKIFWHPLCGVEQQSFRKTKQDVIGNSWDLGYDDPQAIEGGCLNGDILVFGENDGQDLL